ncbi:MAG: flavin reductase family protein [Chloroflexota bacterium]
MKITPKDSNQQDASHLLTDIVAPRPIAWVSMVGEKRVFNLAPFSAYGMVSTKPMVVSFSISSNRDGKQKDTLRNIESTGEFVINVVTEELAERMNRTSAPYPGDVSEFEVVGLSPVMADLIRVPMAGCFTGQNGMQSIPDTAVRRTSDNDQPHHW